MENIICTKCLERGMFNHKPCAICYSTRLLELEDKQKELDKKEKEEKETKKESNNKLINDISISGIYIDKPTDGIQFFKPVYKKHTSFY